MIRVRWSIVVFTAAVAAVLALNLDRLSALLLRPGANPASTASVRSAPAGKPWAKEPISEPVAPEDLFKNLSVETYQINGDTPEQLEASLAAAGPGSVGAEAKTSYQLVLYKGSPSDGRCGYSNARIEPSFTLLLPRWVVMPNVTDEAKQWWSWRMRPLVAQVRKQMEEATAEAAQATEEIRAAGCDNGDTLYAALNTRLQVAHSAGGSVEFHSPGSVVETAAPQPVAAARPASIPSPEAEAAAALLYALNVRSLDGSQVSLAAQRGHVVLLNFWATWCGPCRAEMPSLQRLVNVMKGHDVFFALVSDESTKAVQTYLQNNHFDLPAYVGDSSARSANISAYPTTYILNKSGQIALRRLGGADWDTPDMVNLITNLERQ
jgi:thiol-disulfide isomerase/thioredoxin